MKIKTDILIIGGGISVLSLTIKLAKLILDQEIFLITKESLKKSNKFYDQGGMVNKWMYIKE